MRSLLSSVALAASFSLAALAGGQNQIADAEAREQLFWSGLYGTDGTSLYCGKPFDSAGGLVSASPVPVTGSSGSPRFPRPTSPETPRRLSPRDGGIPKRQSRP